MIISYRKAVPDHGVNKLDMDLRELINQMNDGLNGKLNALDIRVSALEQTGTLTISGVVVDNDNRRIDISVITSDHTTGTSVTFNISDVNATSVSEDATLIVANQTDRQKATISLSIATLVEGVLSVTVTSQDKYGKAHEDKVVQAYAPVAASIVISTIELDHIHRTAYIVANMELGWSIADVQANAQAKLTVTDADTGDVITSELLSTDNIPSFLQLYWEDVPLPSVAASMNFTIEAVDAFGDAATGSRDNVDTSDFDRAGVEIVSIQVSNITYIATVKAKFYNPASGNLRISNSGGVKNAGLNDAESALTVTDTDEGSITYTWKVYLNGLNPEAIDVIVNTTDDLGRSGQDRETSAFSPVGSLIEDWNSANAVAKTFELTLDSNYVANGATATLTLSSAVNGYSETSTVILDGPLFTFPTHDIAAFPFGRINLSVSVPDMSGNTASWDGFVVFSDVQGDITMMSETYVDSLTDTAHLAWKITGAVTITRLHITEANGALSEIMSPNVGDPDSNGIYRETIALKGGYGQIGIGVEGQDGAGRLLSDLLARDYDNMRGVIDQPVWTFNPTDKRATIDYIHENLEVGTVITVLHMDSTDDIEGHDYSSFTHEVIGTVSTKGRFAARGSFIYTYPGGTNIRTYLKVTDVKGDVIYVNTGHNVEIVRSGSIYLNASLNNVNGLLSITGGSTVMAYQRQLTIRTTGAATLNKTTSVKQNGTYSTSLTLTNFGEYTVKVTGRDDYGKELTATATVTYSNVNGSLSISSFVTSTPSSQLKITGSTSRVSAGSNITFKFYPINSSTLLLEKTTPVASNGTFDARIDVPGAVYDKDIPYGNVRVKATVSDIGGTTRSATKDGTFTATPASLSLAVLSKNIPARQLVVRHSYEYVLPGSTITLRLYNKGTQVETKTYTADADGKGVIDHTWTVPASTGAPDIDVKFEAYSNSDVKATVEGNNLDWDNTSEISLTEVSRVAGTSKVIVRGTISNVNKGKAYRLSAKVSGANEIYRDTVTLTTDTGNGATISHSIDIADLPNGTVTIKVSMVDARGTTRTATKAHIWAGNGSITVGNSRMYYNGSTAEGRIDITFSGEFDKDYEPEVSMSGAMTLDQIGPISFIGKKKYSAGTGTTLTAKIPVNRSSFHGKWLYFNVFRKDAAGKVIEGKAYRTNRNIVSNTPSMKWNPSNTQPDSSGGVSLEFTLFNYVSQLEFSRHPVVRYKRPDGSTLTVTPVLSSMTGSIRTYRVRVDDRNQLGEYVITLEHVTSQSTAALQHKLTSTTRHTKEEDATLSTANFWIGARYRRGIAIPTSLNASGKLNASSNKSGVTVYCKFENTHLGGPSTYSDQTDSLGNWSISTTGMGEVRGTSYDFVDADAYCTYNGRRLKARTRSAAWPLPDGDDRFEP